jgi:hypothetical protein
MQDALRAALDVAIKYVPRDQQGKYLDEVRLLLSEQPPKEIES